VSCSENSEKSSEEVVGGWVGSEGHRGVQRYPVWYVSGIGQAQKRGQDSGKALECVEGFVFGFEEVHPGIRCAVASENTSIAVSTNRVDFHGTSKIGVDAFDGI